LFQVIHKDLGNTIYEAELGVVLQVLVGYLNVLYEIREVDRVFTLFVEEYIDVESLVVIVIDCGVVVDWFTGFYNFTHGF
jgi:hypothetical protein